MKQIVGGSLDSDDPRALRTNFVSDRPAEWFAEMYRRDGLTGGHVIKLGPGNDGPARAALAAYPGGLQIGGGITAGNAGEWLEAGASHVIVTSAIFPGSELDWGRLKELHQVTGRNRLVIDLSCRKRGHEYVVVKEKFRVFTGVKLTREILEQLAPWCDEFLIHAVDVEGECRGIDEQLVRNLADWSPLQTTYAGGATSLADLERVTQIGGGKIDLTIGSALDIFGGRGVSYKDVVRHNARQKRAP